ncbi:MAG: DUF4114 domain-containing protein [Janthinobacterium lividum]
MKKLSPFLIALLMVGACKKSQTLPTTVPVEFTSTTYQTLGNYDDAGKPLYLATSDVISSTLLSYISTTLPDGKDLRKTNPELFTTKAIADITMTQKSDVSITYVSTGPGTGYTDAIAFYTYPTNNPPASATDIKTITYIFPNAGNASALQPGNKVKIGTFNVGTSIGFVLLQNAWSGVTKTINTNVPHFCSNDVLNPEVNPLLRKHAVLINYTPESKVLIGFEDTDRTISSTDHDFNDVVIYASVTPSI